MCQNYEDGCREIKMNAEELEYHQEKCIFRPVFCPDWFCNEKKVMFKDVNDHLVTVHKNNNEWKMVNGEANKWTPFFTFKDVAPSSWRPHKMTNTDGDVFYGVANFTEIVSSFYLWIYFLGSQMRLRSLLVHIQ